VRAACGLRAGAKRLPKNRQGSAVTRKWTERDAGQLRGPPPAAVAARQPYIVHVLVRPSA
ncbi:MAG: hypothetical protein ACK53V_02315, partial [Planctomycetota bacterium]